MYILQKKKKKSSRVCFLPPVCACGLGGRRDLVCDGLTTGFGYLGRAKGRGGRGQHQQVRGFL